MADTFNPATFGVTPSPSKFDPATFGVDVGKPEAVPSDGPHGFFDSLVHTLNPIPAIKEWANRPGEIGKMGDAREVLRKVHNEAAADPANKGKPIREWKIRDLTPQEQSIVDGGMGARVGGAEGNLLADVAAPGSQAVQQAKGGDLSGAAGTLVGGYGVPAALPIVMGPGAEGLSRASAATKRFVKTPGAGNMVAGGASMLGGAGAAFTGNPIEAMIAGGYGLDRFIRGADRYKAAMADQFKFDRSVPDAKIPSPLRYTAPPVEESAPGRSVPNAKLPSPLRFTPPEVEAPVIERSVPNAKLPSPLRFTPPPVEDAIPERSVPNAKLPPPLRFTPPEVEDPSVGRSVPNAGLPKPLKYTLPKVESTTDVAPTDTLLDDIAAGMGGRKYKNLSPSEQEAASTLAGKLRSAPSVDAPNSAPAPSSAAPQVSAPEITPLSGGPPPPPEVRSPTPTPTSGGGESPFSPGESEWPRENMSDDAKTAYLNNQSGLAKSLADYIKGRNARGMSAVTKADLEKLPPDEQLRFWNDVAQKSGASKQRGYTPSMNTVRRATEFLEEN